MIRQQSVGWMTFVLVSLVGTYVMGQDEGAAELYGRGLHAYFAGDYDLAVGLLSESIAKNGSDPRAYYFRGLALASTSGLASGLADFTKGADVEINQADRPVYDINGALQRVQGSLRLELEKVRAATRKAAVERQKKRDQVRYEELKRREDIVLFDPNRPAPQVKLDLPKPDLRGKEDPFESGVAFSGGQQVDYVAPTPVEPAEAPAMTSDGSQPRDPFADTTAKAPAEAADPFASPVKKNKPSGGKTPTAESPPTGANPFGDNMPKLELEGAEEPAGPATNIGGGLIDLLGKTLSGQTGNRDPFGAPAKEEPAPGNEPDKKAAASPPANTPAADPFGTPAKKEPAPGVEPEKKADVPPPADAPTADSAGDAPTADSAGDAPTADPAGDAAPKQDPSKKPADKDNDPFK